MQTNVDNTDIPTVLMEENKKKKNKRARSHDVGYYSEVARETDRFSFDLLFIAAKDDPTKYQKVAQAAAKRVALFHAKTNDECDECLANFEDAVEELKN